MDLYVGTSGYSHKEWKGSFYPKDLADGEMLGYYAQRLGSVEINNTFYRMPRESVVESWARQVPKGFRFVIKASRRITHIKKLKDCAQELGYLLGAIGAMGDSLGAVLFQLPPSFAEDYERLRAFLELLPPGLQAAFEFRHPSWETQDTRDLLAARNAALCLADTDEAPVDELEAPADWGYLRLRRETYGEPELRHWAEKLRSQSWQTAYVFFKHEGAGEGPALAERLLRLWRE